MFKRPILLLVGFSLCVSTPGLTQFGGGDVHTIGPDRGGALGVSVDPTPYSCGSLTCLKVIGLDRTNFPGLKVGDYITSVNNVTFANTDQFFGLVRENPPGTSIRIDYWDGSNGLTPMYQLGALRGRTAPGATDELVGNLETIIRADARHWRAYTYRFNSLGNLRISYVSPDRQSSVVSGTYRYDGVFMMNNPDTVDFQFSGGTLSCIKYGEESQCRPLLTQDRSLVGPAIGIIGGILLYKALHDSRGPSSPDTYSGESRSQCLQRCNGYYDPNASAEAAAVDQCRRRC
jgi:hypothetical protein